MPQHESSLKSITTTTEFFKLVKATSDGLARQSKDLEMAEQRLVIPARLSELFPRVSVMGEAHGPSDRRESIKNSDSEFKFLQTDVSHESADTVDTEEEGGDLFYGRSNYSNATRGRPSTYDSHADPKQREQKVFYDKPAEKRLPCYSYAQTRQCRDGSQCVYSHDDTVCRSYVEDQVRLLSESPFLNSKVKDIIVLTYPPVVAATVRTGQVKSILKPPHASGSNKRVQLFSSDDEEELDDTSGALSQAKATPDY